MWAYGCMDEKEHLNLIKVATMAKYATVATLIKIEVFVKMVHFPHRSHARGGPPV